MKHNASSGSNQTTRQELEPSLLLAVLALCLGISDWLGLQIIGSTAFSLLISPQLHGMGIGVGFGLFITFFRKRMSRDDLLLVSRATYRILLLFLPTTIILSTVLNFPPATLLFILGTGLGVISGILAVLVSLWLYLHNSTSSNRQHR